MLENLTLPAWSALHPALAHFPIALLLVAPLVAAAAWLWRHHRRPLLVAAFGLAAAGTVGVYLSAATGDAAREAAPKTSEIAAAVEQHESLGAAERTVATALTALLAALLWGDRLVHRPLGRRTAVVLAVLLVTAALASTGLLVATGHSGGVLVHTMGVHASLD